MAYFGKTNLFIVVAFAVALLLFFLPFVTIKVGNEVGGKLTGKEIMLGKLSQSGNIESGKGSSFSISSNEENDPNIYVIASALFGLSGLVISFLRFRNKKIITGIFGIIAAIFLSALYFQVNNRSDNLLANLLKVILKIEFTIWYFLSIIFFIGAAALSFSQRNTVSELPPANAPQLSIQNPGEQSEFPTSASESEIG